MRIIQLVRSEIRHYAAQIDPRRDSRLDFLRVAATLDIVLRHTALMDQTLKTKSGGAEWLASCLLASITIWGTPIFVMLSGFLNIPRSREMGPCLFIQKRLSKLLLPTLAWTIIALLTYPLNGKSYNIHEITNSLLTGDAPNVLWYLYMLSGLFLFTPLIQKLADNSGKIGLIIIAFICLLTPSILPLVAEMTRGQLFIFRFLPFVGFYLTGYVISEYSNLAKSINGCFLLWMIVLCSGSIFIISSINIHYGIGPVLFWSRLNPFAVAMAICIFIGCFKFSENRVISLLAPLTPGIYITHMYFIGALNKSGISYSLDNLPLRLALVSIVATLLATIAAYLMIRIDCLKFLRL